MGIIESTAFTVKNYIKNQIKIRKKRNIEKMQSLGEDNPNVVFYIINRKDVNVGLFSLYISILSEIRYALKFNMIPVVDLQNYANIYLSKDEIGKINSWEFFFKQPQEEYTLEDAYKSKNVVFSNGEIFAERLSDKVVQLTNKKNMEAWRLLASKHMVYSDRANDYIKNKVNSIIPPKTRYVGVLARGTDYLKLKPKGHPIQPDYHKLEEETQEIQKQYNCEAVFLATEDANIYSSFKKRFGDNLYISSGSFLNYTGGYLGDVVIETTEERVLRGLDYLVSVEMLSRANCLIGGRTSGMVGAVLFNESYEYLHIWDLGVYE